MGVPGFFRWMVQRYPMIRRKMSDPSRPHINNLYIDMNSIFYNALKTTRTGCGGLTPAFLAEILRNMDLLVQVSHPTDLIFIAVDGPAPNAKATEQRGRRFESSKERSETSFDRTQITPGTKFMEELHQGLIRYIRDKCEKDSIWSKCRVIYSSCYVPGEGEHKILNYIREQRGKAEWNPNLVHCMYSTDADLIMLGLQTHEPNMLILRETASANFVKTLEKFEAKEESTVYSFDSFELIHFSLMREYLAIEFGSNPATLERIIDDFIAISFLVGNDFIPGFYDIDIKQGDFNPIIDEYKKFNDNGKKFIVEDGNFVKENLKEFLEAVVGIFKLEFQKENMIVNEEEAEEKFTQKNKDYLAEKYPKKVEQDFESLCYDMAKSILDAFYWVLKYYNSGCPSWGWTYQFLYSPPLQFVLPYIMDYEPFYEEEEFEEDQPNTPFFQQLVVFPPQSAYLMPEPLGKLMTESTSPIIDYYPTSFETDQNGRRAEWQAIVKIPLIEYDEVKEQYDKVLGFVDEEDLKRNRVEDAIEIFNHEEKVLKITKGKTFQPVNLSTKAPDCLPTFQCMKYTSETRVVPVKQFENYSKAPSVVIKVQEDKKMTAKDALELLNKEVLIGYPFLRPAVVVGAIDEHEYFNEKGELKKRPESVRFPKESREKFLLESRALEIDISCFLVVKPLVMYSTDGVSLDFDTQTQIIPTSAILPITSTTVGLRYKQAEAEEPKVGETVVIFKGLAKGCTGRITKVNGDSVNLAITERDHPLISPVIKGNAREWTPLSDLTRKHNISFRALNIALTEVKVEGVNIALQLYKYNKTEVINGHARVVGERGNVEISVDAANLIEDYFKLTGKLKELLSDFVKNKGKGRASFKKAELFQTDTERRYRALVNWLEKNSPAVKSPLVPSSLDSLTQRGVTEMEEILNKYHEWHDEVEEEDIPLATLIRKSGARTQIPDQKIVLGARVICVASSGSVPFGTYGTIVAHDSESRSVSVVFDHPLECGTTLDGMLKSNRGMRLYEREVFCI